MQLGLFDIILLNGMEYRCTRISLEKWGGSWEFLYKNKWHRVVNYAIKLNLNKIINGESGQIAV